ncbi:type II toxin-antitoxin system PemK/MazF family toxin [Methylobacterium sp. Leaf93]|uniref:type II toxin-antitoxin system PemK/MazF family toxin n=1 Tax=Methylobacterium sp. Leaf93 TaxID=1736249 RepID=UPI0006FA7D53|nr:type II toxin-antitoxin system PemK/MazF family toxin [Methylobacterium sp. Leaf93]KQP13442.1 MazF family transcriptional regulator [Methylobacterium sp. Leaf93]
MSRTERLRYPGEIVLVDLEPVRGTEQNGRRPALDICNDQMHLLAPRVIVCPITRNLNPWPTKVLLPQGLPVDGAVLVDQVRSIDRDTSILRSLGFVPDVILAEVRSKLATLIGMTPNGPPSP